MTGTATTRLTARYSTATAESVSNFLATQYALHLWANVFLQRRMAMWHAFIDGYRSIGPITASDFDALNLFVPIRHIWLMGEYAGRIAEWGSEAVPAAWLAQQADLLRAWEDEKLSAGLF